MTNLNEIPTSELVEELESRSVVMCDATLERLREGGEEEDETED